VVLGAAIEAKREAVGVAMEREDEGHVEDKRAADFERETRAEVVGIHGLIFLSYL
jgi:hypothetical protein